MISAARSAKTYTAAAVCALGRSGYKANEMSVKLANRVMSTRSTYQDRRIDNSQPPNLLDK